MRLNENDVNNCLGRLLGQHEDSFQQAWVEILESDPQTLEEITPIIRRVRNKAIKQYWNKKCREVSLYKSIGKNGDETFTLESILESPTNENAEEKGRQKGNQFKVRVQLQRDKLEFRKEQLYVKKRNMLLGEATSSLTRERSLG